MNKSNKDANLKEKLRQALASTFKVISDDFTSTNEDEKNKNFNKFDFINLENINTKSDFIKQELNLTPLL